MILVLGYCFIHSWIMDHFFNAFFFVFLLQKAPPLVARWVPFAAVAAANCVNIPMMRQQ